MAWGKENGFNNGSFDPQKDFLVLESKNLNVKKSFHITIRNGFVFPTGTQKQYAKLFSEYLKKHGGGLDIDLSVYSSNSNLRVLGSHKVGCDRTLIRSNYNQISRYCKQHLFFNSNIEPELKTAAVYSFHSERKYLIEYLRYVKGFKGELTEAEKQANKVINDAVSGIIPEGEISDMVKCILESIDEEKHSLCDDEFPDKLNYNNWKNLIFTIFNCCKNNEDLSEELFGFVYPYYRHCEQLQSIDKQFTYMYNYSGHYDNLNISLLMQWANQNDNYTPLLQSINEKPEAKRTAEEKKYKDLIIAKILAKNMRYLFEIPEILCKPTIREDDWVDAEDFNDGVKCNAIQAGLGMGKSTASATHIQSSNYTNIVVFTPRRSYARGCCSRLKKDTGIDFILYLDKKGIIDDPFVVIQAESLHRLITRNSGKLLLVMDECEAFFSQMTSEKTHGDNHIKNVQTFLSLVRKSNKIICCDAFMSRRTIISFKILGIPLSFYKYTKSPVKRTAKRCGSYENFCSNMLKDVEDKKKIFIFSTSKNKLCDNKIKSIKNPNTGIKEDCVIEGILPLLKRNFPDRKKIEFHSGKLSSDLDNANHNWCKADIVSCTSTITVGIDVNEKDVFHKQYLYANASAKNLVRDIFQGLHRIRHFIENELVLLVNSRHFGMNLTTNINEIQKDIINKTNNYYNHKLQNCFSESDEGENGTIEINEIPKLMNFLITFNTFEENMSIMNMDAVLNKYLEICNYDEDEADNIEDVEFDTFIKPSKMYKDIPDITPTQFQNLNKLKSQMPLTEDENNKREKYIFQNYTICLNENTMEDLWLIYTDFGRGKFRNISYEKGLQDGTITIKELIEKSSKTYACLQDNYSVKCEVVTEMINLLGLKHSQEIGDIKPDVLDKAVKILQDRKDKINITFGMRDSTKAKELTTKSAIALVNKVFDRWGFTKLKTKRTTRRVDGKRADENLYSIEFNPKKNKKGLDIAKYIRPKGKITIKPLLHPLLNCREDAKCITIEELEEIRLR